MRKIKTWGGLVAVTGLAAAVLAMTGAPANASAAYQFPLPTINLAKSANVQSYAGAGIPITYTYDVTNDGDVPLSNATVTDPMAGLSAIDCGGGTNVIAELDTGASQDCTATYTTTQNDVTAGSISNVGTVTGTTPAGATVSYNANLTIAGVQAPINCQKTSEYFLSEAGTGPPETLYYSYTPPGPYHAFTPVLNHKYNAIGFGYSGAYQGFVYAMVKIGSQIKLLKFGGGGYLMPGYPMSITGYPTGVPQPLIGSFDASGNYWVAQKTTTTGSGANMAYEIDVNSSPPAVINSYALSPDFDAADWAYSQNYLWGMRGHTMYRAGPIPASGPIPVSTFTVPVVSGYTFAPGTYGAAWTYANGDLGFSNNGTGKIYQIAVTSPATPTLTEVPPPFNGPNSSTPNNDGTDCLGENANLGTTGTGPGTVATGSTVSWNVTVTDNGPGDSSGFVLDGATKGAVTGLTTTTPGCSISKGNNLDCAEGELDNGDSYTVTLTGTMPTAAGKCVTTTVTATGDESDTGGGDTTSVQTCTAAGGKTWTAKPGGDVSGKSGAIELTDTTSGVTITCKSSALTGTLQSGSGLNGAGIGSVTGLSLNDCAVEGLSLTETSSTLPWSLNAVSYSSGVTSGTITGIDATLSSSQCALTLDGTGAGADNGQLKVSYSNSSHQLAAIPTGDVLNVYNVTGCLGLFSNGDAATVKATYAISPAQSLTSP